MIKFNEIYTTDKEKKMISDTLSKGVLVGETFYHKQVLELLNKSYKKTYLVHTCTAALEIAALALNIKAGDEVIMPSYTFVSSANAFALRGAKIVFVDVNEEMVIDLQAVKNAITEKTKVVVPVHYGGCSCDMKELKNICGNHIYIVEDAAQSIFDKSLGTYGDFSCISLHSTKNITSGGEGGILVVNNSDFINKVSCIVEKGTNRISFQNKEVEKYTWQTLGSSFCMDGIRAAYLYGQLLEKDDILERRKELVALYQEHLSAYEILKSKDQNGHLFYIKAKNNEERDQLRKFLYKEGIESVSHYEPLHLSAAGKIYGEFKGLDKHTSDAYRLLRLPLHLNLKKEDIVYICQKVKAFYE